MFKNQSNKGRRAICFLTMVIVLIATIACMCNAVARQTIIEKSLEGAVCGALFSGVRLIAMFQRRNLPTHPLHCWLHYVRNELKCGCAAGFVLGLVVAMVQLIIALMK